MCGHTFGQSVLPQLRLLLNVVGKKLLGEMEEGGKTPVKKTLNSFQQGEYSPFWVYFLMNP